MRFRVEKGFRLASVSDTRQRMPVGWDATEIPLSTGSRAACKIDQP
jgi:hypothetical protein